MKKILILCIFAPLCFSCSSTKKTTNIHESRTTSGTVAGKPVSGDGSSYESAIIITEKSETKGVDAEYKWLHENYPGYTVLKQSLNFYNKKPYDILDIKAADGIEKNIYFDISNFYGKF
jgi:hypothetical protein